MTQTIKKLSALTLVAALALFSMTAKAQGGNPKHRNSDWAEKAKTERIAYLTSEMGLTPEEAQKFWPIYNQYEIKHREAWKGVMNAYSELSKASEEGKSEKELAKLIDNYTKARDVLHATESEFIPQYKKVISNEKLAKFLLGEEKFRRNKFRRFQNGGTPAPKPADPVK